MKLRFLVLYCLLFCSLIKAQILDDFSVNINLFNSPSGFSPNILSFRQNNLTIKKGFNLGLNSLGFSLSLTTGIRDKSQKIDKKLYSENYMLLSLDSYYSYSITKSNKHYFRHAFGTYLYKDLINIDSYGNEDNRFFESVSLFSDPNSDRLTIVNVYGFIETGYDFYVYKGLHLSLTGRATLLSYNLNFDSNGNPTDEKRLGLNYMLFYGLGYTFGRDK